jgi:hypothetical protein
MNKLVSAAAAVLVLSLTACGGGNAGSSGAATPSATGRAGVFDSNQTCNQLLDKGDESRLIRASTFAANLLADVDRSQRTLAKINAGDLEYAANTANDTMKPLILDLAHPLKELGESDQREFDREAYKVAEAKVLEKCKNQYSSYQGNKAKKEADAKVAAEAAAKKAAEEAAVKAAAEAAEAAAKAPKEYSGAGADVLTITKHGTGPQVAVITHTGWSNFAVHTLDATLDSTDLLVNTIGNYSGTVLFDVRSSRGETTALKITADGTCTVKLVPLTSVRSFDGTVPMTGRGDDVFAYTGAAKAATFTHDGSSNIAVKTYGARTDLLINEIGAYTGTVVWSPGFYQITADGNWSATLK